MDRNSAVVELDATLDHVCLEIQSGVLRAVHGGVFVAPEDIAIRFLDANLSMVESGMEDVCAALVGEDLDDEDVAEAHNAAIEGSLAAVDDAQQALWQVIHDLMQAGRRVHEDREVWGPVDDIFRELRGSLMELLDTLPSPPG